MWNDVTITSSIAHFCPCSKHMGCFLNNWGRYTSWTVLLLAFLKLDQVVNQNDPVIAFFVCRVYYKESFLRRLTQVYVHSQESRRIFLALSAERRVRSDLVVIQRVRLVCAWVPFTGKRSFGFLMQTQYLKLNCEGNKATHLPETTFLRSLCECITSGNPYEANNKPVGGCNEARIVAEWGKVYKKKKNNFHGCARRAKIKDKVISNIYYFSPTKTCSIKKTQQMLVQ